MRTILKWSVDGVVGIGVGLSPAPTINPCSATSILDRKGIVLDMDYGNEFQSILGKTPVGNYFFEYLDHRYQVNAMDAFFKAQHGNDDVDFQYLLNSTVDHNLREASIRRFGDYSIITSVHTPPPQLQSAHS